MKRVRKYFLSVLVLMAALLMMSVPGQAAVKNRLYTAKNGYTYYFNSEGKRVRNGFVTLSGKTYAFDANGRMIKGKLFKMNNKTYCAFRNGVLAKNRTVTLGKKWYFFNSSCVRLTGWVTYKNQKYYFPANGEIYKRCWKKIGGFYYWFHATGYCARSKWVGGYYFNSYGHWIGKKQTTAVQKANNQKKVIQMTNILQNPELPTGCEAVALTMALRHRGYNIPKTLIASKYLTLTDTQNWVDMFYGDPFTQYGAGIASPGLAKTANKFLVANNSKYRARNIVGTNFKDLYRFIDEGTPVIVWNSMYMREPVASFSWTAYGRKWTFFRSDHCVVLCGYDKTKGQVLVNDSLSGLVWRDAANFERIYNIMGRMAVVIR